jgi:glycosyltransferase involved in cell wall biosynthesis
VTAGPPAHRLVLDAQATQSVIHGDRGIARYVREQTRALLRLEAVEAILLNPNLPFPKHLDQGLATSPLLRWNTASELRRVAESADGPLAYYVMSPFEGAMGSLPAHALDAPLPVVATLYDLIPLLHADRYLADPKDERRYRTSLELLRGVDLVLSISEHSRRDAIDHLGLDPRRLVNISAGVSSFFTPTAAGDDPMALLAERLPELRTPYVLTVSGGDARKNTEALLDAWARVPRAVRGDRQLVVACSVTDAVLAVWSAHARAAGLGPEDVVFTGWISDEILRALYRCAELFVFPPLYEGFGLPAAEAMACGCPVITSSTSSLPEVVDWEPATFDPADPTAIADAVTRGLVDDAFRAELLARGRARTPELTWDAVARRTVDAVADVVDRPRPGLDGIDRVAPRTELPVRIALVGPQPPSWSGIADYNARLLPTLAARAHVDVYTPDRRPDAFADLDVGWFPPRALGWITSPWSYDAVVYTVGNSDDHHDLYQLAQEFPGILWMHDVRLPGLYITFAQERVDEDRKRDWLLERLDRQYRRRLSVRPGDDIAGEFTEPYVEAGLGLSKELVDVARGVVVSSHVAERLLRLDQGPDAVPTPTWVVPLAAPPVHPEATPRAGAPEAVVVSLGGLNPIKGNEVLVRATPTLVQAVPGARVVLAGVVNDTYRGHLEKLAADLGVAGHVELPGRIDAATYDALVATATCAVQLRTATNGESSAAVLDCLAAGLPVVTNVAAATELPAGTVDLVPYDVDPHALGRHLAGLVTDDARLADLAGGGRRYAAGWGAEQVVDRLLDIVAELQRASPHRA